MENAASGAPLDQGNSGQNPPPGLPGPVFDAHVDSLARAVDLGEDLTQAGSGHLDLPRAAAGGLGTVVMACWPDPEHFPPHAPGQGGPAAPPSAARLRTEALLDAYDELLARAPDKVLAVGDGRDLQRARASGRLGVVAGIEGGHALDESLAVLEHFYRRGVRVLTLTWNNHISWARSCCAGAGPEIPAGLSEFGRAIVRRMNELGMVIDLSHVGEQTFYDALETSGQPLIASHSACRSLSDHPRNLDDDQLRALAAKGGVIGIVFCTLFLDRKVGADEFAIAETAAWRATEELAPTERFFARGDLLQATLPPFPMQPVVDHIVHAAEIMGVEHVGLGSDFDGIFRRPAGLEDVTGFPRLAAALLDHGFTREDVSRILGGNLSDLFARITARQ